VSVEVIIRPEAQEDIRNLPSTAIKLEAAKYILRLEHVPKLGLPLEDMPEVGDLSDCRKIFLDERRYRIVYRVLPNEDRPKQVDVIVVGPRELLEVYVEAVRRLGH
jgi:mRNA-degrading endonuclease RelE of RelBE toxin-antitoxin system